MSWTRLDDNFDDNPKVLRAIELVGDSAGWAWVRAINYCNKHLTNGRFPLVAMRRFTSHKKPYEVADALVSTGAFGVVSDDDLEVHDFLHWNDSREKVLAARAAVKARKDAWRERQQNANGTRSYGVPERVPDAYPKRSGDAPHTTPHHTSPEDKSSQVGATAGAAPDEVPKSRRKPGGSATHGPMAETAVQIAWRCWRETYAASRRRYGDYVDDECDGKLMAQRAKHAERLARERQPEGDLCSLLEAVFRHWFEAYMRDDGSRNFPLADVRHAFRYLRSVASYGSPWSSQRPRKPAAEPVTQGPSEPLTGPPPELLEALRGIGRGPSSPPPVSLEERQRELRQQVAELADEGAA